MNCTPRNFLKNHWGENRSVRKGFNADESALFWGICHKVHTLVKKGSELQDLWQKEATSMILCKRCQVFVQMIKTPLTYRAANPEPSGEMINTICQSFGCTTRRPDNRNLCGDWCHQCFIPEFRKYLGGYWLPFKILLISDNALGHPEPHEFTTEAVKVSPFP